VREWGRADTVVLPAMAEHVLATCPVAGPSWYEGVGHPAHLEEGMGGHLELTGALRDAMFTGNRRPRRKDTTTKVFWDFAAACRDALARLGATQAIL
jgi:hypothetical protein